jgi:hypothetical protein
MYLDQVAAWIDTQDVDYVYWNMLHDAPHFSIANLPKAAKQAITNRLVAAPVSAKNKQEFVNIIDFMNNGKEDLSKLMIAEIRKVDKRRNENFAQVQPEFAELIGYH